MDTTSKSIKVIITSQLLSIIFVFIERVYKFIRGIYEFTY